MILRGFGGAIWPLLFWCLCISEAAADVAADATSGQDVLLATYYEIEPAGCQALRAPQVRLTAMPELGRATVVRSQHQPVRAGGRCGTMAVPVTQVRYRADRPGTDRLAWEVRYQARDAAPQQVGAEVRVAPARAGR